LKRGGIYCSEISDLATTAQIEREKLLLLANKGLAIHSPNRKGEAFTSRNKGSWHSLPEKKMGSIYCSVIREMAFPARMKRGKHLLLANEGNWHSLPETKRGSIYCSLTKGIGINCPNQKEEAFIAHN